MGFNLTIICCILLFICSSIAHKIYQSSFRNKQICCITFIICILSLLTVFNIHININIHFTIFTIPNLLLFISAILIPWNNSKDFEPDLLIPSSIVFSTAFFAYIIASFVYETDIKISAPNVIEKTETNLDTIKINDNYFYAVYDSSGYKYSIINENNEPELTTSPEDATKIHYISENEKPHLEKIVEESYKCYKGDIKNYHWEEYLTVSYILYIPEGSIDL